MVFAAALVALALVGPAGLLGGRAEQAALTMTIHNGDIIMMIIDDIIPMISNNIITMLFIGVQSEQAALPACVSQLVGLGFPSGIIR